MICDRGWELGYIPATSFLPAKCVGQAQNVRVSVCVCVRVQVAESDPTVMTWLKV